MKKALLAFAIIMSSMISFAQSTPKAKAASHKAASAVPATPPKASLAATAVVKTPQAKKVARPLKKDGTPDKRYKVNTGIKKDGTPDKRYKANKKP